MASWLNHTLAEAQRLQDNCWSVKAESCGRTVLRSYDSRFLQWGSVVFLLNDLPILPRAWPPNNYSPIIHLLHVKAFAWNTYLFQEIFTYSYIFPVPCSQSLLLPPHFFFFCLSLNLKSKICLNWLQRARGGFVSTVMRVLIGPEAQAANRPLLVCRGPLLAR